MAKKKNIEKSEIKVENRSKDIPVRYFIKRGLINRAFTRQYVSEKAVFGFSKEDYIKGMTVEIDKVQAEFYTVNPTASFDEIIAMKMNPIVAITEIPIEEQYQQRLREEISKKYTLDEEIRILYNGKDDTRWQEHEDFVDEVKKQVKKELGHE